MKKLFFTGLLALAGSQASASLIGSVTHDYGTGGFNPGGTDALTTNGVIVSDWSHGRFYDVFHFSGIPGTITSMDLVLDYSHAGPRCTFGLCFLGERWEARIQGSDSSAHNDDLFVGLDDRWAPQTIALSSATDVGSTDVWSHSLSQGSLELWFSESSWWNNTFLLDSTTLNIFGEVDAVSVPEPSTMTLMGLGLVGVAVTRRRRKGSIVTQ